jgi:hypothetical protein
VVAVRRVPLSATGLHAASCAERLLRFAAKPVLLLAITGGEVERHESSDPRSLRDITGLTRAKMPPLCGNIRIRVDECRLNEKLTRASATILSMFFS